MTKYAVLPPIGCMGRRMYGFSGIFAAYMDVMLPIGSIVFDFCHFLGYYCLDEVAMPPIGSI
jgi:hypothetical protein